MGKFLNSSKFCYIMSLIFYIVTIVEWIDGDKDNSAIMWLCFGSMWLCIGATYKGKDKKKK